MKRYEAEVEHVSSGINRYKADLRDFKFLLLEQFPIGDQLGKGVFANWGKDECAMVLDEVYRFSCEVTGPLNSIGDQGCRLENGRVIASPLTRLKTSSAA